ncbi:MAG: iron-sulfur cluster assembly protein [Bacteroidetes bacterium]|nr:iron-sulfur cluster assembly protein [Bacteroidota bacterium]
MELKEKQLMLEEAVINVLKTIYDPEIPVNIFDLGLIYEIIISENLAVKVIMTLTSPNCPVAESLPVEVKEKLNGIEGVSAAEVEIVFEPTWDKDMMSEEAKLDLGFL